MSGSDSFQMFRYQIYTILIIRKHIINITAIYIETLLNTQADNKCLVLSVTATRSGHKMPNKSSFACIPLPNK